MTLHTHETFGPWCRSTPVADHADAITRANDTVSGTRHPARPRRTRPERRRQGRSQSFERGGRPVLEESGSCMPRALRGHHARTPLHEARRVGMLRGPAPVGNTSTWPIGVQLVASFRSPRSSGLILTAGRPASCREIQASHRVARFTGLGPATPAPAQRRRAREGGSRSEVQRNFTTPDRWSANSAVGEGTTLRRNARSMVARLALAVPFSPCQGSSATRFGWAVPCRAAGEGRRGRATDRIRNQPEPADITEHNGGNRLSSGNHRRS